MPGPLLDAEFTEKNETWSFPSGRVFRERNGKGGGRDGSGGGGGGGDSSLL